MHVHPTWHHLTSPNKIMSLQLLSNSLSTVIFHRHIATVTFLLHSPPSDHHPTHTKPALSLLHFLTEAINFSLLFLRGKKPGTPLYSSKGCLSSVYKSSILLCFMAFWVVGLLINDWVCEWYDMMWWEIEMMTVLFVFMHAWNPFLELGFLGGWVLFVVEVWSWK